MRDDRFIKEARIDWVLIQGTFGEEGMFILDEPEAALSPQRQLTLLLYIHRLAQKGSQFIIASHSPFCWGFHRQKFCPSMTAEYMNADMRIQRVIRSRKCLLTAGSICFTGC